MKIIHHTILFVKEKLQNAEGGHDWFHVERVYNNALLIAEEESCDLQVIKLAALLHDVADSKFHNGDETIGPKIAREFLVTQNVAEETINHVIAIIENISYKGGNFEKEFHSKELEIVQDADRLDAIGAIGIGRAFAYGGFMKREMHNPDVSHEIHNTFEEYKNKSGSTINHFYEKLLLLKDKMNTKTGREKAMERHEFMESFLVEFYSEWEGSH